METVFCVYFFLLIAFAVTGILRWRHLSTADKFLAVLAGLTIVDEAIAFLFHEHNRNNMVVYHIYSPLELLLLSLYFNQSVVALRRWNAGIIVGIAGFVAAAVNAMVFQPTTGMNSNFLLLEGTAIIVFCLLSLHQIVLDEIHQSYRLAHFWITCLLMIYWSLTFTGWGVYMLVDKQEHLLYSIFYKVLSGANLIMYAGLALIFLFYKMLIPSGR
jgi:hypothetical protein